MSIWRQEIAGFRATGWFATAVYLAVATATYASGAAASAANLAGVSAAVAIACFGNRAWAAAQADRKATVPRLLAIALLGVALSQATVAVAGAKVLWPFAAVLAAVAVTMPAVNGVLARYFLVAEEPRIRSRLWLLAALAGFAAYAVVMSNTFLNHDTQWYLIAVQRWIDGQAFYRDIVEVNPPLAFFLTLPPVALAQVVPLPAATLFVGYVVALLAASIATAGWLLHAAPARGVAARRWLIAGMCVALLVYPIPQFGQREHFVLLLCLPYVVLVATRQAGAGIPLPAAIGVGAAAGLGFALKPYFLLVPLLLGLCQLRRHGLRALLLPENAAMAATIAAYAAAVAAFFPVYLHEVVPTARLIYHAGYADAWGIVLGRPEMLLLPCMLVLVVLRARADRRLDPLTWSLLLACLGFAGAYVWQQKGWFYQAMPLGGMLISLVAWLAASARPAEGLVRAYGSVALAALVVVALAGHSLRAGPYHNQLARHLVAAVPELAAARGIYALAQWMRPGVALAATVGATWCSRYPALWYVPGTVTGLADPGTAPADRAKLLQLQAATRSAVVEDFRACRPDFVVVEPPSAALLAADPGFDYRGFLLQDPSFAAIWSGYVLEARLPYGHEVWRLRHRKTTGP